MLTDNMLCAFTGKILAYKNHTHTKHTHTVHKENNSRWLSDPEVLFPRQFA